MGIGRQRAKEAKEVMAEQDRVATAMADQDQVATAVVRAAVEAVAMATWRSMARVAEWKSGRLCEGTHIGTM